MLVVKACLEFIFSIYSFYYIFLLREHCGDIKGFNVIRSIRHPLQYCCLINTQFVLFI